jgi:rubrerythrin
VRGSALGPETRELVMPQEPSYLDMLNSIYMGEQRGYEYLSAWADVTPDPEVRAVLRTISLREGEHASAFAKRINELGYEAHDDGPSDEFHRKYAIVTSDRPDLEKMDTLGYNFSEPPKPSDEGDRLVGLLRDPSIDIRTGELLGRFIAEERDTGRLFRSCYDSLCARASARASTRAGGPASSSDRLAGIDAKVDAVCRSIEELRQIVCAQTMTADTA